LGHDTCPSLALRSTNASQGVAVPVRFGTERPDTAGRYLANTEYMEDNMPILLWLLGVPLGLVIVLVLLGVV
jgi:hypothetical protein